ncbi:ADI_G0046550.mRNA.1.CDS.1 [Saccharomyces cerevisiae]|nr:Trm12p [Saccharomyces cerevisiae YJM972]AJS74112.1 Trm12p [Saccharomyces cerevisiae YJM981]AJS74979.1 Trm12p [Saccharomyces cerevisiae YJM987]CAI4770495.1 ADI_G0046550.mRNA.1.CDS.1 [Saccharomyces cerevisiae]CAI6866209.1 ADI_G0046550.mRNA.1.CDS.1 [Saccharomyces cerevisiae]
MSDETMPVEFLVSDKRLLKTIKVKLETNGLFVTPIYSNNDNKVIKSSIEDLNHPLAVEINNIAGVKARFHESSNLERSEGRLKHQSNSITEFTKSFLKDHGLANDKIFLSHLLDHLPLKYTIYPPVVLFNNSTVRSFNHPIWQKAFQLKLFDPNEYYRELLCFLSPGKPSKGTSLHPNNRLLTHLAINNPITEADVLRRPFNIQPLYGKLIDDSILDDNDNTLWENPSQEQLNSSIWCKVIQNGVTQIWSPVFTMFSRGNIKEKKRVLTTFPDICNNDVVDLYAGIGYFTFSYLTKGARTLFAFELNPWSVEGLKRGLKANGFSKSGNCHVFQESNEMCVQRLTEFLSQNPGFRLRIRHINLGLLPSSKQGWPLAIKLIYLQGASLEKVTMHIHENVHIDAIEDGSFEKNVIVELDAINESIALIRNRGIKLQFVRSKLERIKTFAPDIWHVCVDVDVIVST